MTTKRIIVEQIDNEEQAPSKYSSFDAFTDGISKGGITTKDLIIDLLVLFFISLIVIVAC